MGGPLQERSQQPLSTEGPHLSVPASVIVSAPPPAQDPALATPVTKGAGLGPQTPDSQTSPAPAPQVDASWQPGLLKQLPARSALPASVLLSWETRCPLFFMLMFPECLLATVHIQDQGQPWKSPALDKHIKSQKDGE